MTRDDVDAFLSMKGKTMPAAPDWRESQRAGERRAYLPITCDGRISPFQMTVTVKLSEPAYLMVGILAPPLISRLCMTTDHQIGGSLDRVEGPHIHAWHANRPKGQRLSTHLRVGERLPPEVRDKDAALSWFLAAHLIDSPLWLPMPWPHGEAFL